MADNIYLKINQALTWKRIIALNLVMFLVLVVPLAIRLASSSTENRSSAAGEDVIAVSPTPQPNYPSEPPRIERVSTFFGKPGDSVILLGANFGDYQWGSRVTIGGASLSSKQIVRWSDTIIEAQIPEEAVSGVTEIEVNEQVAMWEGKLHIYNDQKDVKVGLVKASPNQATFTAERASTSSQGLIELAYVAEPMTITPADNVTITKQETRLDVLGKKMIIEFSLLSPLSRGRSEILRIDHPSVGTIEILRTELQDQAGNSLNVFADPLGLKI